jgi:hypothetical protein
LVADGHGGRVARVLTVDPERHVNPFLLAVVATPQVSFSMETPEQTEEPRTAVLKEWATPGVAG